MCYCWTRENLSPGKGQSSFIESTWFSLEAVQSWANVGCVSNSGLKSGKFPGATFCPWNCPPPVLQILKRPSYLLFTVPHFFRPRRVSELQSSASLKAEFSLPGLVHLHTPAQMPLEVVQIFIIFCDPLGLAQRT